MKKVTPFVLILIFLFVFAPSATANNDVIASGISKRGNTEWYLDNDVMTISGSGSFYYDFYATAKEYMNQVKKIIVQEGVTIIEGLYDFENLATIELPSSLRRIAFEGCTSLSDVYYYGSEDLWSTVEILTDNDSLINSEIHFAPLHIVASGFCGGENNGTNLTWVADSNGSLTISGSGKMADYNSEKKAPWFDENVNIINVELEEGIITISRNALSFFGERGTVTEIHIPEGVEIIGGFRCDALQVLYLPASLKQISGSIDLCFALTDVYYGGDETMWKAVDGVVENEVLSNVNIHYTMQKNLELPPETSPDLTPDSEPIDEDYDDYDYEPDEPTEAPMPEQVVSFTDVPADAYYAEAVAWAVKNGITEGTSETTFSPDAVCTRAQVVTFLWRAMGRPEPNTTMNPFVDVHTDTYYYKAMLWAVEMGITNGTGADTFSPNATCTRAHIITFLWRAAGKPTLSDNALWYADASTWAENNGLLSGTAVPYTPGGNCPRADVVTYLYRELI